MRPRSSAFDSLRGPIALCAVLALSACSSMPPLLPGPSSPTPSTIPSGQPAGSRSSSDPGSEQQGTGAPQGTTGQQGAASPQGTTGQQGTATPQGTTGPQGTRTGTPQGTAGQQGTGTPQGTAGQQGTRTQQGSGRAASGAGSWGTPSGGSARIGELESRIQDVIGTVDGILEESNQQETGQSGAGGEDASGAGGGFPTSTGLPSGTTPPTGGSVGGGEEGEEAYGSEPTGSETTAGERDVAPTGPIPTYGEDSDTFRRQICEAAQNESDPELREALEKECRKYGGTVR